MSLPGNGARSVIMRALARKILYAADSVALSTGEGKLALAVVTQAATDFVGLKDSRLKDNARSFLLSEERCGFWCELIGLDREYLVNVIGKFGGPVK